MKWVALIVALGGMLPLALWLRENREGAYRFFTLVGSLPFVMSVFPLFDMSLFNWRGWRGLTNGFEVTVIDFVALAIFLSLPPAREPLPFRFVFGFYFLAVLVATSLAEVPLTASFYAWQFLRMYLVYAVVARICAADDGVTVALLKGMSIGLALQSVVVIYQRFGLGIVQAMGTFYHQNTLGMVSHFVVLPHFALLLAGWRRWQAAVSPMVGVVVAILTVSRATVAFSAFGLCFVYGLSTLRRWTPGKAAVGVIGLVGLVSMLPLVKSSFERRFITAPLSVEDQERQAFERAAAMIMADHPMGVGPNHYVFTANKGYSDRAGVISLEVNRNQIVHNAYWVAAVETGYLGLCAFVLLLFRPLWVAFSCGWRQRDDRRADLLLGLGAALLTVYLHSFFEWILFSAQVQYMLVFSMGMIAGSAQRLGYFRPVGAGLPPGRAGMPSPWATARRVQFMETGGPPTTSKETR